MEKMAIAVVVVDGCRISGDLVWMEMGLIGVADVRRL